MVITGQDARVTGAPKLYLDADLSPKIAAIARGLGLDTISAHDVGMADAADADQLARAAAERRVLVTRNRDDFVTLTLEAYHDGAPHGGILIVNAVGPPRGFARTAHALAPWATTHRTAAPYAIFWLHV